jgi:hypothetical protein
MAIGSVISVGSRLAVGTLWAGVLTVAGMWSLAAAGEQAAAVRPMMLTAGVGSIGAGQFVFMVVVGDRLFPRAARPVVSVLETTSFLAFAIGAAMTAWFMLAGGRL